MSKKKTAKSEPVLHESEPVVPTSAPAPKGRKSKVVATETNHDGNASNNAENAENEASTMINLDANHDATMTNHDATMMNHDANHDGTMTNHDANHDATMINHDGTMTNHDANHDQETVQVNLATSQIQMIRVDQICVNTFNPRRFMDKQDLEELAESIKINGLIQPITVRPYEHPFNTMIKYMVIAGNRRFKACKLIKAPEIPAIVKDVNQEEALEIALLENLQRVDPHPLDESYAFQTMQEEMKFTIQQIAERMGKSAVFVYNRLALLNLSFEWQTAFYYKVVNLTAAQMICKLPVEVQNQLIESELPTNWEEMVLEHGVSMELTLNAIKEWITTNYDLMLEDAVWDIHNEAHTSGSSNLPACKSCPKQTCYMPDLFGANENMENARCMDKGCFAEKTTNYLEFMVKQYQQQNIPCYIILKPHETLPKAIEQSELLKSLPEIKSWNIGSYIHAIAEESPLAEGEIMAYSIGKSFPGMMVGIDKEFLKKNFESTEEDPDEEDNKIASSINGMPTASMSKETIEIQLQLRKSSIDKQIEKSLQKHYAENLLNYVDSYPEIIQDSFVLACSIWCFFERCSESESLSMFAWQMREHDQLKDYWTNTLPEIIKASGYDESYLEENPEELFEIIGNTDRLVEIELIERLVSIIKLSIPVELENVFVNGLFKYSFKAELGYLFGKLSLNYLESRVANIKGVPAGAIVVSAHNAANDEINALRDKLEQEISALQAQLDKLNQEG